MEKDDEVKEYDRIIKDFIKDGFFDEQEEQFECDLFNDSNPLNETTNLYEDKSENLNKFNVYFNFRINEKSENIFLIKSDELNIDKQNVSDLISNIVKKVNSKKIIINNERKEFVLSLEEYENIDFYNNNYEIQTKDKISHTPKYNYLCLSQKSKLNELIGQELYFVVKKSSNIKLLEKSDDKE